MKLYVARDKDIVLYKNKPEKGQDQWYKDTKRDPFIAFDDYIVLPKSLFPNVKWTDKEPTEVKLVEVKWVFFLI